MVWEDMVVVPEAEEVVEAVHEAVVAHEVVVAREVVVLVQGHPVPLSGDAITALIMIDMDAIINAIPLVKALVRKADGMQVLSLP